jgi:hypothetical protein
MPTGNPAPELDPEVLAAEIAEFLDQFTDHMEVAEEAGTKLNRLLLSFVKAEVLPQATQAAELGIDPTPILAVVAGVLRMYADALERPNAA